MKIIISCIFVFCYVLNLKSDTLEIKKNIYLVDENDFQERLIKRIVSLDQLLDGYLIFEIPNIQPEGDTNNFFAKIFYLDTLSIKKNDSNSAILYNVGNQIMIEAGLVIGVNDSIYNNFKLIWKCFRAFNKEKLKDCQPFLFDKWEGFTTNIFEGNILVERNFKKYFIYRIKLNALIYEFYNKKNTTLRQIFVPLTELKYFESADIEKLEKYGFRKSSDIIKYY